MKMTLRVLFFGPVRAQTGADGLELDVPSEISQEELWSCVLAEHPQLKPHRPAIRLAREGEFLAPDERLHPGDEIALIPPVSGG
jgi:molybdopterin converting factor subunit 1